MGNIYNSIEKIKLMYRNYNAETGAKALAKIKYQPIEGK